MHKMQLFIVLLFYTTYNIAQSLPSGDFSYKDLDVYLEYNGRFSMGSGYEIAVDILDGITWHKGNTICKNNIIICKREDNNEVVAIFQILDINRVRLLYTANNLIDRNKIDDWAFKDSIMSMETAKEINECKDSIIFYRTNIYNEERKKRYILHWKDKKVHRVRDTYTLKLIINKDSINKIFQNMKKEYQY